MPRYFLLIVSVWIGSLHAQKRIQNSLNFDGMDDVVEVPSNSSNNVSGGGFTIEAWIKPTYFRSDPKEGVVIAHHHAAPNRGYVFGVGGTGQVYFGVYDDSTIETTSSSNIVTLNSWNYVAATYLNRKLRVFVNGQQIDSMDADLDPGNPGSVPLTIGRHYTYQNAFAGNIDEVRIWKEAKTTSYIQANYNLSYCGHSNKLAGYYRFNRGRANATNTYYFNATDWSEYANRGRLKNFSLSGSYSNYVNGFINGQLPLNTVDTVIACDVYRSPSNLFTWTQSGEYIDTVLSDRGCDSAIEIHLTIRHSSSSQDSVHVCGDYTLPSGRLVSVSGVYTDRIPNYQGCDSVITVTLKTGPDTTFVDTTVCHGFTLPINGTTFFQSGSYTDTLKNEVGCDSLVYYQAYVLPASRVSQKIRFCDSVVVPTSGNVYYTSQQVNDTLVNHMGCDSIITYILESKATESFYNDYSCGDYISPSGKYTWKKSGVWKDTLTNFEGCDSLITIDLQLTPVTDTVLKVDACRKFRAPSRRFLITESGVYYDTVMNIGGCDSIIQIEASITAFNNVLQLQGDTLIAQEGYGFYQWLDVENGYSFIQGENEHYFAPTKPGEYAVQFDENGCSDTSEAIVINKNLEASVFQHIEFNVYPNPSDGRIFVEGKNLDGTIVEVMDLNGRIIAAESFIPHYEGRKYIDVPAKGLLYVAVIKGNYKEVVTIFIR